MAIFNKERTGGAFRDLFSFGGRKPISPQVPKLNIQSPQPLKRTPTNTTLFPTPQSPQANPKTQIARDLFSLGGQRQPIQPVTPSPIKPRPLPLVSDTPFTPTPVAPIARPTEQKEQISAPVTADQRKSFVDLKPNQIINKLGQVVTKPTEKPVAPTPPPPLAPIPTPTPEVAAAPTRQEQIASLRQTVLGQFAPTEKETELQRQINAILGVGETGIIREEQRPIPKPFVTGKQEAIERRAEGRLAPLQREQERLSTERVSQAEIATKQLEFLGGDDAGFTLAPGQSRFDSTGKLVASVVKPDEDPLDELLSPNELALFNAPAGSTMRDVVGAVPKSALTEVQKFTQEIKLGKEFESLVGDARKASTAVTNINSSLDLAEKAMVEGKSINAASQGILVAFQKLLDPTSVVRESEYARSGNGQSLWDSIKGTWQKIEQGGAGVTLEELNNFVDTANVFLKGYENSMLKHAKRMQVISERQGLDLPSILTEDVINLISTSDQTQAGNLQANQQQEFETLKGEFPDLSDDDILQLIQEDFSQVGGDTDTALNRPQRNNNPGNVKSGGIADQFAIKNPDGSPQTDDQGHLIFPDVNAGVQGLSQDLSAKITGRSRVIKGVNPTIAELGKAFAEDPGWANSVAQLLGVNPNTRTQSVNFTNLVNAVATQEGFFA